MSTMGLTETQLLDLISGRIHGSLQQLQQRLAQAEPVPEVLPELGMEIAKVVAAAIHANNVKWSEQAQRPQGEARSAKQQEYDHLSQCIDGY